MNVAVNKSITKFILKIYNCIINANKNFKLV